MNIVQIKASDNKGGYFNTVFVYDDDGLLIEKFENIYGSYFLSKEFTKKHPGITPPAVHVSMKEYKKLLKQVVDV